MATPDTALRPPHVPAAFMRRVRISNFRSIGQCDVALSPLTILVGRNGAGKSNFLDALRFVSDALDTTLDHALKSRGGIDAVRRKSTGHPRNFGVSLRFGVPPAEIADYQFEIAAKSPRGFTVRRESLRLSSATDGSQRARFEVADGELLGSSAPQLPRPAQDRLFLVAASSVPEFRGAYDALRSMGFYNLSPEAMRELQSPDAGELLHRDGSNVASVIGRIRSDRPQVARRIDEFLATIVPGVSDVRRVALGPKETLQFRQDVEGSEHPWQFPAVSMSDGTLRAFGVLVAVMQLTDLAEPVRLVGVEEPETALHPLAAGALMQAVREASRRTQVVVTTHSADLLDCLDLERDALLVVESRGGSTVLASPAEVTRSAIREHLYTPGELLRMDQLRANEGDVLRQSRTDLFDADVGAGA